MPASPVAAIRGAHMQNLTHGTPESTWGIEKTDHHIAVEAKK